MNLNIKWLYQHRDWVALLFILVVATYLRTKGLTTQSYWVDELFSVRASHPSLSLMETLKLTMGDEVHPPLYQILLLFWYKVYGFTEFSGRFFSVVSGVLSVAAIFFLGKELRNSRTGLYCAAITATNVFLIHYSQETRSYSLLALLSVLSFLFLIRLLKNRSKGSAIAYVFLAICLIYTHYFGLLVIASQTLCFAFFLFSASNKMLIARIGLTVYAIIGIAFLPLLKYIIVGTEKKSFWIPTPDQWFFVEYFQKYFGSSFLVTFFALLLVLFFTRFLRDNDKEELLICFFLVIWVGFCLYAPYLRSILSIPMLWDRYTIIVVPAFIAMIAIGLDSIPTKEIKDSLIVAIFFISVSYLFIEKQFYNSIYKDQMREVCLFLKGEKNAVPIYSFNATDNRYNAYFELLDIGLETKHIGVLKKALRSHISPKRFWLIDAHHGTGRVDDAIQELHLKVIKRGKFYRANATLVEMKTPS